MTNTPQSVPASQPIPDSTAAMKSAVKWGVMGLIALAVVGALLGGLFAGKEGVYGALIGAAVGGGFILFTALGVLLTAKLPALTAGAVLLGTWLLKMILAMVVLFVLSDMDFYNKTALVLVIIMSLVVVLGAETYGVLGTKTPYVDPTPSSNVDDDE
ncbi:membrane protein [Rhodococcus erythropolis]|uniref:membrane protein n=1 Tax=Rhodococcus erythropolis TaxID=1833 RepID=UPI0004637265